MKIATIIIVILFLVALTIFCGFGVWTCDANIVERIFTTISLILISGLLIWYGICVYNGWN